MAHDDQTAEEDVNLFGYKQELNRTLRFFSLFAIAFSIVSISTGVFLNYGFAVNQFGGASIWTWPIAAAGQIVMALLIAELSTKIPLAGYAYQWGARLVGSGYGWYTGFFGLLYMSITGGAIILLGATPLLLGVVGLDTPAARGLVLAVAIILVAATVVVNIVSVQLAARVNNTAVVAEILGLVLLAVVVLICLLPAPGQGRRREHLVEHERDRRRRAFSLRPGRPARHLHHGRLRALS